MNIGLVVCPDDEECCPKCDSFDIVRHHYAGCLGECDWWECESCKHEWGHA